MNRKPPFALTLVLSAVLAFEAPASAASCWSPDAIGAARLREFEVMLMAVTMRCNRMGFNLQQSFDQFRVMQKRALEVAETKLRAHFGINAERSGRLDYDRFLTSLGNFYGTGKTDGQSCTMFQMVATELGKPSATIDHFADIAMQMIRDPKIETARCAPSAKK